MQMTQRYFQITTNRHYALELLYLNKNQKLEQKIPKNIYRQNSMARPTLCGDHRSPRGAQCSGVELPYRCLAAFKFMPFPFHQPIRCFKCNTHKKETPFIHYIQQFQKSVKSQ